VWSGAGLHAAVRTAPHLGRKCGRRIAHRTDVARNSDIDVYAAFSRDGGATLDGDARLTDASFVVPPLARQPTPSGNFDPRAASCYMGEYIGVTADDATFYYAWGDNRRTVVSTNYPSGRPDPDIYFDRLPVPPVTYCVGDCDRDASVNVNEIVTMVGIALGTGVLAECPLGDGTNDGQVTITDLLAAVDFALTECPQ
jgi:hypothetical protein